MYAQVNYPALVWVKYDIFACTYADRLRVVTGILCIVTAERRNWIGWTGNHVPQRFGSGKGEDFGSGDSEN